MHGPLCFLFLFHPIGIVSWRNSADREVTSFIQISRTMSITYAPDLPTGLRLRSLSIGGKPVDFERTYTISTIDFVANGGDGFIYPPKKPGPPMNTLDVVLADYLTELSPFRPFLDGRIKKITSRSRSGAQTIVNEANCYGINCIELLEN